MAAVRDEQKKLLTKTGEFREIKTYADSPEKVFEFLEDSGLSDLFSSGKISNLVDYVIGVEVGLDSNARKNRAGKNMERLIRELFSSNNIFVRTQLKSSTFKELSTLGNDIKAFDFVVKTNVKTYLIEVNFYSTGGSKLNETARAYTEIARKINAIRDFEFVWITDGIGWLSSQSVLEQAFNSIPKVFNLTSVGSFISLLQHEGVIVS